MKQTIISLATLLVLVLLPTIVKADTITITSGTLTYVRAIASTFSLEGQGLNLNGQTSALTSTVSLAANGLMSQGQMGFTGGSVDSQDSELLLAYPITIGGIAYSPGSSLLAINFSSAAFIVPVEIASGFVVVAPFSLTIGIVEGYPGALGAGVPMFSGLLTGHGTTTLTFLTLPNGQFQLYNQSFTFGQTVSGVTVNTIPEPTTMILLGSGLTGLIGVLRKRLKGSQ